MTDSEKYTPLSERLQQDVWHDNFVPKYSGLASARPSLLIAIGVWLIFVPMILMSIGMVVSTVTAAPDVLNAVLPSIAPTLFFLLAVAILVVQTQRYRTAEPLAEEDEDEEQEDEEQEDEEDEDEEDEDEEQQE